MGGIRGFDDIKVEFYADLRASDGTIFTEKSKNGFLCQGFSPVWRPKGLLFNGNLDYVTCYVDERLDNIFDNGGSIGIYFKINSGSSLDHQMLLRKGNIWRMMIRDKIDQTWRLHFIEEFSGNDKKIKTINWNITDGRWYHVVVSYNSGSTTEKVKLYINGRRLEGSKEIDQGGAVTGTRRDDSGNDMTICGAFDTYRAVDGLVRIFGAYSQEMQEIEVVEEYEKLMRICI